MFSSFYRQSDRMKDDRQSVITKYHPQVEAELKTTEFKHHIHNIPCSLYTFLYMSCTSCDFVQVITCTKIMYKL